MLKVEWVDSYEFISVGHQTRRQEEECALEGKAGVVIETLINPILKSGSTLSSLCIFDAKHASLKEVYWDTFGGERESYARRNQILCSYLLNGS